MGGTLMVNDHPEDEKKRMLEVEDEAPDKNGDFTPTPATGQAQGPSSESPTVKADSSLDEFDEILLNEEDTSHPVSSDVRNETDKAAAPNEEILEFDLDTLMDSPEPLSGDSPVSESTTAPVASSSAGTGTNESVSSEPDVNETNQTKNEEASATGQEEDTDTLESIDLFSPDMDSSEEQMPLSVPVNNDESPPANAETVEPVVSKDSEPDESALHDAEPDEVEPREAEPDVRTQESVAEEMEAPSIALPHHENAQPIPSRFASIFRWGYGIALGLALLMAGGGIWLGFGLNQQVALLQSQIASLQMTRVSGPTGGQAGMKALKQQVALLQSQFAKLQMGDVSGNEATEIQALRQQVDKMQQQLDGLTRVAPQIVAQPQAAPQPVLPITPESRSQVVAPKKMKQPAKTTHGAWSVNLTSVRSKASAEQDLLRFHALGLKAESVSITVGKTLWYRIRIPGFASKKAARERSLELGKQLKIDDIWVNRS